MDEREFLKNTAGRRHDPVVRWETPDWLEDHQHDPGLIILDTRANSHAYFAGHIPGAVYLHEAHLRSHIGQNPVRWIAPDAAEILLSSLGIVADTPVVVYAGGDPGSGDGMEQYLVAYSLARYGCRNVILLDGGLGWWNTGKHLLSREYGVARLSPFRAEVQSDFFISREECARQKESPDVVLLDTRPLQWYEGQGPWVKPGHIPRAINLPAFSLLDPVNPALIRPEEELRDILALLEITPEKTIICSCGTGRTATAVFLILRFFLGYPEVVMYEGGFTEWSSLSKNPVTVGKTPR